MKKLNFNELMKLQKLCGGYDSCGRWMGPFNKNLFDMLSRNYAKENPLIIKNEYWLK